MVTSAYDELLDLVRRGNRAAEAAHGVRIADALRHLSLVALVSSEDDAAVLADRLEAIAASIPAVRTDQSRYSPEDQEVRDARGMVDMNARGTHPLIGSANPTAPPLTLDRSDDRVIAHVAYDARYEGLPGQVHGGIVAAGFDLLVGQAIAFGGVRGVTASLTVRYRRPTPTGRALRYEAWLAGIDGRKITTRGRLVEGTDAPGAPDDDCTIYAEADGLFIAPRAT